MATNLRNFGVIEGRLVADPRVCDNKDGSKAIFVTVAVPNNFKTKNEKGEMTRESQFVNTYAFLNKDKAFEKSVYNYMHKGDLVGLEVTVRSSSYQKEDGTTEYTQRLLITNVDLKTKAKGTPAEPVLEAMADYCDIEDEEVAVPAEEPAK